MGFVSHHVEALPFIRKQMERHETLVLEEPSAPSFPGMLDGHLSVDDYLLEICSEFPRFGRLMCGLLMECHDMGRRIIQVEPYLERLIEIHERFADGKSVADVMASASLRAVNTLSSFTRMEIQSGMIKKPLGASTSPRVSCVHPTHPAPAASVSRAPSRTGSCAPKSDAPSRPAAGAESP